MILVSSCPDEVGVLDSLETSRLDRTQYRDRWGEQDMSRWHLRRDHVGELQVGWLELWCRFEADG
jgi:hypothetical protein